VTEFILPPPHPTVKEMYPGHFLRSNLHQKVPIPCFPDYYTSDAYLLSLSLRSRPPPARSGATLSLPRSAAVRQRDLSHRPAALRRRGCPAEVSTARGGLVPERKRQMPFPRLLAFWPSVLPLNAAFVCAESSRCSCTSADLRMPTALSLCIPAASLGTSVRARLENGPTGRGRTGPQRGSTQNGLTSGTRGTRVRCAGTGEKFPPSRWRLSRLLESPWAGAVVLLEKDFGFRV